MSGAAATVIPAAPETARSIFDRQAQTRRDTRAGRRDDYSPIGEMSMRNTRTTLFGVGTILAAIGGVLTAQFDTDANTVVNWTAVIAAVTAGLGLIFARDSTPKE